MQVKKKTNMVYADTLSFQDCFNYIKKKKM